MTEQNDKVYVCLWVLGRGAHSPGERFSRGDFADAAGNLIEDLEGSGKLKWRFQDNGRQIRIHTPKKQASDNMRQELDGRPRLSVLGRGTTRS